MSLVGGGDTRGARLEGKPDTRQPGSNPHRPHPTKGTQSMNKSSATYVSRLAAKNGTTIEAAHDRLCEQTAADLQRWNETGELPAAWAPDVDDEQIDEINRDPEIAAHFAELDAIESGCVEPQALGWINQIGLPIRNEHGRIINWNKRPALDCNCGVPYQIQCDQHGPRE